MKSRVTGMNRSGLSEAVKEASRTVRLHANHVSRTHVARNAHWRIWRQSRVQGLNVGLDLYGCSGSGAVRIPPLQLRLVPTPSLAAFFLTESCVRSSHKVGPLALWTSTFPQLLTSNAAQVQQKQLPKRGGTENQTIRHKAEVAPNWQPNAIARDNQVLNSENARKHIACTN